MNKLKVLCTGSGGFIASNFVRNAIYEKKPYEFVSIDKVTKSSVLNNIYTNKNHQFYIGDIADEHFVNVIFEYERPDIVLHMAAETFVDDSLRDPNKFIHSNVLGTQVLVNASIKWGVKNFIYISTDEVYGQLSDENAEAWKEDAAYNPRNPYSASKAAGEFVVRAANSSFGLNYSITRSCNNYGPRQTAEKFIPKVVKCILEGQKIPVYGQGLQIRDWLHVFDNCAAIIKVLESGKNGEIYNISSNQEFTNIEVVQIICNIIGTGHNLISHIQDPRTGHDFRYAVDASKMRSLGWEPQWKFKDGIKQTVEWYLNNKFFIK
jgi:dTDP-glucose 4,6-dehydratase